MALRTIRLERDEILRKRSKPVTKITPKIQILIDDMIDTLKDADGVGLAAPQVGILKRIVVIDVGEGPIIMINPEIIEAKGEVCGREGCLSIPGETGLVKRPGYVKANYTDRFGAEQTIEGCELLAVAICHELDHLDGILYIDKLEEEDGQEEQE